MPALGRGRWPHHRGPRKRPYPSAPGIFQPAPFSQSDWPNPQPGPSLRPDLRTWTNNLLQGTLAPAAPVPFGQRDWPNPQGRRPADQAGPPNLLATTLAPAAVTYIFRDPLVTRYEGRQNRAALDSQPILDLLGTTLTGVVASPFSQWDWPNPQPGRRGQPLEGPPNLLGSILVAPFHQADWPNPRATAAQQAGWILNLLATTLATPIVGSPFSQTDWPNPQALRSSPDLRTWLQSLAAALTPGVVAAPFAQADWPNPQAPRGSDRASAPLNLLLTTLSTPFSQLDWPNPRGSAAAQQAAWILNLLETTLSTPFRQQDWAVPRGQGTRPDLGWLQDLLGTTLAPPVQAPFRPLDWPNPGAQRLPADLRTWLQSLQQTTLQPPAGTPFAQTDWPNPQTLIRRAAFPQHFRRFAPPVDTSVPFGQTDWPNPQVFRRSVDLLTWLNTLALHLPEPTPDVIRLLRMLMGIGL